MKKLLLALSIFAGGYAASAQDLAPDQNPNYKVSLEKYTGLATNLETSMNTTVQETYKAYDWSTAKAERKAERRNFRRERTLFNNYNNGWNDNNWNNGWNNNSWNNNNRWNNNCNPFFFRW